MKKLLNRQIAIVAVAVIATVAFFSFKSGDDRNFQIAKNLDIFNAIVKELDMFYVDTIECLFFYNYSTFVYICT